MVIELRGVEFVNKGAELMLHAILQKVKEEFPDTILVMEQTKRAPRKKQRELGIYTKTNITKFKINFSLFLNIIPRNIKEKLFLVSEKDIDIVLDGSGFAFGDFWGANKAGYRMANHIVKWKNQNKKNILLPQAFGPFTDSDLRDKMKIIVENANLIFARDKYSFEFISEISERNSHIYKMPDFTNLVEGIVPDYFKSINCEIAIIPNTKLTESGVLNREDYLQILGDMIEEIETHKFMPFFLVHEGVKDLKLVQDVNSLFGKNIKIIKEEDPIKVKGIIGHSKAVITSRFHGLVSALSQAVPCLCIGWSHKYEALMEDYDYTEGLLNINSLNKKVIADKLNLILNTESARDISNKLKIESENQKLLSKQMWSKVFEVIK
jgi:colanic acid/amylovoran biosynthesis protein